MTLLTLILLAVIGYLLQQYMLQHSLDKVDYRIKPSKRCVEINEEFKLQTTVSNNKGLPVFFLRLSELVPDKLVLKNKSDLKQYSASGSFMSNVSILEQSLYIMPYQRVRRSLSATLPQRGRYLFRGARLRAGDFLGIDDSNTGINLVEEMVVYPQKADISSLQPALGGFLGEMYVRRFIMPDPIEVNGFSEYDGTQRMKDISWKQTLKKNRMMVKKYDYTAKQRVTLMLDIDNCSDSEAEQCYSLARSVSEFLENNHITYSFYTNAQMAAVTNKWAYIPDGNGLKHSQLILEGLGRGELESSESTEKLLRKAARRVDDGRSYILICPRYGNRKNTVNRYNRLLGQQIFVVEADRGNVS